MRCIVCQTPGSLQYAEVPEPTPARGEAVVGIRRIGICGTDLHAFNGRQPYFTYPRVLGHELAGEIISLPDGGTGLAVGTPVTIIPYLHCGGCVACRAGRTNCCRSMRVIGVHQDGGMCDRLAVPVGNLIAVPRLSLEAAAIVECLAIGAHAVRRAALDAGDNVLVIGAGPIGLGAMQFADIAGGRVIAMDIDQRRLDYCRDVLGVAATVNGADDPAPQLADLTEGEMPTVIFDATGNAKSMEAAFGLLAHSGRLIFISLVQAEISFADPEFHKRETTLLSSRNATRADFDHVIACLEAGRIEVDRFITHPVDFAAAVTQFPSWLQPTTGCIKAMIEL